jgi:hypothetical protein
MLLVRLGSVIVQSRYHFKCEFLCVRCDWVLQSYRRGIILAEHSNGFAYIGGIAAVVQY